MPKNKRIKKLDEILFVNEKSDDFTSIDNPIKSYSIIDNGTSRTLNLSFEIKFDSFESFVSHWKSKYSYDEQKYFENINNPLTSKSRLELFEWKNGTKLSEKKLKSIENNYPLEFPKNMPDIYLNSKSNGGAIWNIFYLHCHSPEKYPIFDQHNCRAMNYLMTSKIIEIPSTNKKKYEIYITKFIPFFSKLNAIINNHRELDKALFVFGQFLKKAKPYITS